MKKTIYTFALGVFASTLAIAQDSTAAKKDEGKFTVSGYIDSYYLHAFNNPKSGNLLGAYANSPAAIGYARAFDRLTDQFSLGLVQTKFSYINKKSEMLIDLTFGPNAELGNFGNQRFNGVGAGGYATGFYPGNPNQSILYGTGAAIKQAFFKYNITDKLSFTVGQFGTHVGYEVIDAPINYNYSLSNLFNNGPFYHVGAKVNYAFSDRFGLMVGLVNNWDAMTDWKKQKSVIAQAFISPVEGWNVYINYIGGFNDDGFKVAGGPGSVVANTAYAAPLSGYTRNLFDLTTGYQITDKFYMGLNAAYGFYTFNGGTTPDSSGSTLTDKLTAAYGSLTPAWGGVAVYSNYQLTDWLGIGGRYEYFNDKSGVRYINAVNQSLTITMPITLADGHLILKPEFRMDWASYSAGSATGVRAGLYEDKNGQPTWRQQTLGMAFIYKY